MRGRRILVLLLAVLLLLLSVSCTPKPEEPPVISVDGPINTSETLENSPFVGTFRNTYSALFASLSQDVFEFEDDIPLLEALPDGTFTLRVVDTGDQRKVHTLKGTFSVQGDVADFTAEGEDTPWFTMTLLGVDEIRYGGGEFYCVYSGDIFSRE